MRKDWRSSLRGKAPHCKLQRYDFHFKYEGRKSTSSIFSLVSVARGVARACYSRAGPLHRAAKPFLGCTGGVRWKKKNGESEFAELKNFLSGGREKKNAIEIRSVHHRLMQRGAETELLGGGLGAAPYLR